MRLADLQAVNITVQLNSEFVLSFIRLPCLQPLHSLQLRSRTRPLGAERIDEIKTIGCGRCCC